MQWSIDHFSLKNPDVPSSVKFYESALGMRQREIPRTAHPDSPPVRSAIIADDRGSSLHLIPHLDNFFARFSYPHNPAAPHTAITVSDIGRIVKKLDGLGWRYSPPREWGPAGFVRMYTEEPLGHLMEFNSPVAATESVKGPDRFDERPGTWSLSSVAIVSLNALETSQWLAEILYPGPESTRQGPSEGVFYEDSPDRRSIRILTPSSKSGSFFNPTLVDHFGVTVRDLKMVAANLDDMNVPYSTIDSSLYVHDPAMNLIEVLSREE